MKRLATLAAMSLALTVASLARADWHPGGGMNGGPLDSWIADAGTAGVGGYFSVHTTGNAAYRLIDNGSTATIVGSVQVPVAQARCSAIGSDNKVKVGGVNGFYDEANTTSPGNPTIGFPNNVTIQGCRATGTLAGLFSGTVDPGPTPNPHFVDAGLFGTAMMNPVDMMLDNTQEYPASTSANTIFGREYGYIARPANGSAFFVDGTLLLPKFPQTNLNVLRSEIFGARDGGVRVIQVGTDGGQLLTLAAPNPVVFEGFGLLAALVTNPNVYRIKGVSLSELEGGPHGAGFGMLLVESTTPGTPNLWRAIPDPNNVGRYWVPSNPQPPPPAIGIYDSVRCLDARFCVLGSSASTLFTPNQIAIYRNRAQPTVEAPAFTVQEGVSSAQSMTVDAGDADDDPVFVTWVPDSSYSQYFNSLGQDLSVRDGRTWQGVTTPFNGNLCGRVQATIPVTVFVSDGLFEGPSASGSITVVHTPPGQPGPDLISPIQAGLIARQTYTFFSNQCPLVNLRADISPTTLATATLTSPTTLEVVFTPPRVWCDDTPGSGLRQFAVKVVDGLVSSPTATATFIILPWGEPEPPFGMGRTVFQDAGSSVTYRPEATHLCEGDAGTFPGVDTFWTWTPSGANFNPTVLQADAGLLPRGGAVTPTATVVASDCESGSIAFQATNTTRMDGGLSASSSLTVNVTSPLLPLGGTLTVTAAADGGAVEGVVDLSPIQCQQNRPDLVASVELHRASDGGLISSGTVAGIPAPYSLPRSSGACGGGPAFVRASVSDSTGSVGPVDQPVNLQVLNPGFASVTVDPFKIACRDVARSHGVVTYGPTDCDSAQVDWSSVGAVAIAPGAMGTAVDLATVSNDFNGLIGLPVDVVATASAENGVKSVPAPTVLVTVDPFVSVVHRTDTAVASESRVMGVEVQLTNDTDCDVTDVELHEAQDGLLILPESVIGPDGGSITPVPDGGEMVVPGLSLPARQAVTVRYSARPTLFGAPSPGGVAKLRDVPISSLSGLDGGTSTCGCQSDSGGGTALTGLAGLAFSALLRRRRKVRARS